MTKSQAQGALKRALEVAGYAVKTWNKKLGERRLTRLYVSFKSRELGYVQIDVGRIHCKVDHAEHGSMVKMVIAAHVQDNGLPEGARGRG